MHTALAAFVSLLLLSSAAAAQTKPGAAACEAMKSFKLPGTTLEITKADWVAAGSTPPAGGPGAPASTQKLPAYCRIDGVIDRRTGGDGRPSRCLTIGTADSFSRAAVG